MTKYIHIHATCNFFEIFEQVPENLAVKRLKKIRENFLWAKVHNQQVVPKKKGKSIQHWCIPMVMDEENKLSVSTRVVNPELPFVN